MRINNIQQMSLLFVAALLAISACSSGSDYVYIEPASVSEVSADLWEVTLTDAAVQRTGVETTEVTSETMDGAEQLVIPYSAVMYHYDGTTWTYMDQGGNSYLRSPIEIDHITGDKAYLTAGPPIGQTVVTVGAAELYGVEFGIGK